MNPLESKEIAIIIVTYNDFEKTLNCLKLVHQQSDKAAYIIVCDNGSDNYYMDKLLQYWSQLAIQHNMPIPQESFGNERPSSPLVLLRLPENGGYPAALNGAVQLLLYNKDIKGFWFLHNDVLPKNFTLSALLRHSVEEGKDPAAPISQGIVGSTVFYEDRENIQCVGGGTFSRFWGKVRLCQEGISRFNLPDRVPTIKKMDFVYGASFLVRREVFEKIGLFAEEFFHSFEDVDFSIRAKKAGFLLNWAPGAVVRHIGPVPGKAAPIRALNEEVELPKEADYYNIRNRFFLLKKLHPYSYIISLLTLPFPLSVRWFKGQKSRFQTVLDATFDGIKGRMHKIKFEN